MGKRQDDFRQVRKCDICQQVKDVHKMALAEDGEKEINGFICDMCFRILVHVSHICAELEILHCSQDGRIKRWME